MKVANKIILIFLGLSFPVFSLGILFGLAGSTATYYLLVAVGYIVGTLCSVIALYKDKFVYGSFAGVILIATGFSLDTLFWSAHNAKLCAELRTEPTCVESDNGFSCKNFKGYGFSTGLEICD